MKKYALLFVLLLSCLAIKESHQQQEAIENTVEENEEENGDDAAESAEEPEEEVDQLTKRGEDTMQTNIGYLFRGYSILEGNPLDPTVFDPGFKSKIFQATYEQNKRTDDQRYKIPDNVDILAKEACSSSFSSETVMTESDYQRSLLAKASLSASGKIKIVDASFSASSEYKRMSKLLKTNTKSVIRSEATCTIYEGRVQTGTPPKFSDNFLASVKILKEEPEYGRFLDTFGTHFVEAVDMGARFTKLQEISKETQEKLKEQGIDIKTTASVSAGPIGSGSAEAELKISKDQKDKFEKAVEQTKVVTLGSKPPRDGKADTWISEAIQNPLPTSYRLRSITELFGAAFFTKEDGVDYKKLKADLTRYLEGYCKEVKSNRLPSVQCAGPPKGCSGGSQCSVNAVCNDNPSSDDPEQQYDCKCKAGYKGDGRICSRQLKWMPGVVIEQDSDRGEQGTWGGIESCENGIFANGFLLRAEKEQGAGDDSGANAVCLKCDSADICSKTGTEGEWSPKPFMCPEGSFLSGWRQNVEKHKGLGLLRDDTALDNVEYKCRDGRTWKEVDANMKGQGKEWGSWSKFKECPKFQFICGINTRVRDSGGDDTGLNDIKHQCCKPLIAKKAKKAKESKKRIKKY